MLNVHQLAYSNVWRALVIIVLLLSRSSASGAGLEFDKDFQQQMRLIYKVQNSLPKQSAADLTKYEQFAKDFLNERRDDDVQKVANYTKALCRPLSRGRFDDDRQYQIARKLSLAALKFADKFSLSDEIDLVQHVSFLQQEPKATNKDEFARERLRDAQTWLHALRRFASTFDPKWDENDVITMQPEPPLWLLNAGGIDSYDSESPPAPESITDPTLRAKYEKLLEDHKQKLEHHTIQHALRHRLKDFPRTAEQYLVALYSQPPSGVAELTRLVKEYEIENPSAQRILKRIEE